MRKPCILPWINFGTNPFGRPRACGYSDIQLVKKNTSVKKSSIDAEWNSEYFKTIRKDFIDGKWPENCKRCKYVEELGGVSKRMDENNAFYADYSHHIHSTKADGSISHLPRHIDIRTGTTCNQKCIHCGTGVSSKWREDKPLFNKYPNTEEVVVNDRWIDQDTKFWDYLRKHMIYFKRYNFLGGESFANKQHNLYLKELSESEYASDIELQYVTNGILLTQDRLDQLSKFKKVNLRLSVDAPGSAGEYFRFPMVWQEFIDKTKLINDFISDRPQFDVGFQWTCSNISMYYLPEMYPILAKFTNIKFIFSNHVEFPQHMSAQNLPTDMKKSIAQSILNIEYTNYNLEKDYTFYINHMLEKDLWSTHGTTLMNYLDDLDQVRGCDWRTAFSEMELQKHDPR